MTDPLKGKRRYIIRETKKWAALVIASTPSSADSPFDQEFEGDEGLQEAASVLFCEEMARIADRIEKDVIDGR